MLYSMLLLFWYIRFVVCCLSYAIIKENCFEATGAQNSSVLPFAEGSKI